MKKVLLPAILCTASAFARAGEPPTGTVTGHVLCADTQRPGRLARVKLVRVPTPTDEKPGNTIDDAAPPATPHRVSGQVITKSGHAVNAGTVDLLYADDKSEMTGATIDYDDQRFHLDYVPEGDFLLRVKDPRDVRKIQMENAPGYIPRTHEETRTVTTSGEAEQPSIVKGDRSDILITGPPAKPATR